ncbi:hypothetical protein R1sor_012530 [Riccia sorocarpa]|uniref:cAMP-regulated phosphoprotein 19-related protein n=1 Tax=Riccia sorocarpa TaxID=122646 RepID=A0ABD3I5X5_9MARC
MREPPKGIFKRYDGASVMDEAFALEANRTRLTKMAASGGSREGAATENAVSIEEKEQETLLTRKYGGMCPKRPSLLGTDNERAFFDSADWALCKQGATHQHQPHQLTRLQSLPPKLVPTPHQPIPARRASYAPISVARTEEHERRRDRRVVSMICPSEVYNPESSNSSVVSPPKGKAPE